MPGLQETASNSRRFLIVRDKMSALKRTLVRLVARLRLSDRLDVEFGTRGIVPFTRRFDIFLQGIFDTWGKRSKYSFRLHSVNNPSFPVLSSPLAWFAPLTFTIPGSAATLAICLTAGRNPPPFLPPDCCLSSSKVNSWRRLLA